MEEKEDEVWQKLLLMEQILREKEAGMKKKV